jgi:beta-1,2-mannobiose phosphorylase / 1,2-beta-oligomannan phosphorylase
MVLSKEHPRVIRYRSAEPVLTPELPQERQRDRRQRRVPHRHRPARRSWLAGPLRRLLRNGRQPDWRGALDLPDFLPPGGVADPPEAKV